MRLSIGCSVSLNESCSYASPVFAGVTPLDHTQFVALEDRCLFATAFLHHAGLLMCSQMPRRSSTPFPVRRSGSNSEARDSNLAIPMMEILLQELRRAVAGGGR